MSLVHPAGASALLPSPRPVTARSEPAATPPSPCRARCARSTTQRSHAPSAPRMDSDSCARRVISRCTRRGRRITRERHWQQQRAWRLERRVSPSHRAHHLYHAAPHHCQLVQLDLAWRHGVARGNRSQEPRRTAASGSDLGADLDHRWRNWRSRAPDLD